MQNFVPLLLLFLAALSCSDSHHAAKEPDHLQPGPQFIPPQPTPTPPDARNEDKIPALGEDNSFEFGTWNIENFPKSTQSVSLASEVLRKTRIDLMALEEVASEVAFQQLLDALPGFRGVLSPHQYQNQEYQKLAFIYREADVELLDWELLFTTQEYVFPRPPLQAHFRIKTGLHQGQDVYFIAVHLKATSTGASQQRREEANVALESYVTELGKRVPGVQVTLLGDFNERVNYDAGENVFKPWLAKPETYTFQTQALAKAGDYSFISTAKPMLDHMISTNNVKLGPITIPKLENMITGYRDLVSDHLPVMARDP